MIETLQILQLIISFFIVPVLGYVITLEKRITRLETKIEVLCNEILHKGGEKK